MALTVCGAFKKMHLWLTWNTLMIEPPYRSVCRETIIRIEDFPESKTSSYLTADDHPLCIEELYPIEPKSEWEILIDAYNIAELSDER